MKQINNFPFYELGAAIVPLKDVTNTTHLKEVAYTIMRAQFAIRTFLDERGTIPLDFSMPAARELYGLLNGIIEIEKPFELKGDPEKELGWAGYHLGDKARNFEHVLAAELQKIDTYFVPRKGIFSTPQLMERADELFDAEVRKNFPAMVRFDICQAGKCIACELGTAAGFHIARAMEGVLIEYLHLLSPSVMASLKESARNLGNYIRLARENGGEEKLCGCLDQFRDLHRNPLMHPDAVLTTTEAISLLGIAQSAMIAMTAEIVKLSDKNTLPSLDAPSIDVDAATS